MHNSFSYEEKEHFLLVRVTGIRKNFMDIYNGTKALSDLALKLGYTQILADYRKARFDVPKTDAFNLVKLYDLQLPHFKNLKLAGIVHPDDYEIGEIWESIGRKKEYNFKVFTDYDEAEEWLLNAKPE